MTLVLALGTATPAIEPEPVPLQAIGTKKASPLPASRAVGVQPLPIAKPRPALGLIVAPKIGAEFGVAGPLGASLLAALELGYRLPLLKRVLGVSVEGAFANPSGSRPTELGAERTTSLALSFPLLVSANVELGPGLFRVLAGPAFTWWKTDVSVAGFQFHDTVFALAAVAALGYAVHLGPGALGGELRYRLGLLNIAGEAHTTHALGLGVTYLLLL